MTDFLFVHIDTTSNAVLTNGISQSDFVKGIVHQPKNLLLLDPYVTSELSEYDPHTALRIIRGSENVSLFFNNKQRTGAPRNWIDFSDVEMLKELTPLEISELLYFGHMKTHLHSPFFYKLQNDFVFFPLQNGGTRIYYRYLDEFYRILSGKIAKIVSEKISERRTFFRRTIEVPRIEIDILKDLRSVLQEGVILCFAQAQLENGEYRIPICVTDEHAIKAKRPVIKKDQQVGCLLFDHTQQQWQLTLEDIDLGLAFR